uniref:Uncharacterized protein n=1 Tax=Leersia perrieri TaxID=77586 RepID=A0A0D9W9R5_9ORYZ
MAAVLRSLGRSVTSLFRSRRLLSNLASDHKKLAKNNGAMMMKKQHHALSTDSWGDEPPSFWDRMIPLLLAPSTSALELDKPPNKPKWRGSPNPRESIQAWKKMPTSQPRFRPPKQIL